MIIGQVSVERVCTLLVINTNLMACLLFSSLYHLTAIAWERYVAIRKCVEYKIIVAKGRLKRLAMVAWLAAIVTTFPVLIMELMGINSKVLQIWIIVGNVCGATTFVFIVYSYIMVWLGIRKRKTSDFCQVKALVQTKLWGGSRGGSGGSVEPPKLNVKTYNKRVVKKKVNQLSLHSCSFTLLQLSQSHYTKYNRVQIRKF